MYMPCHKQKFVLQISLTYKYLHLTLCYISSHTYLIIISWPFIGKALDISIAVLDVTYKLKHSCLPQQNKDGTFWKVAMNLVSLHHCPVQGYVAEGRLRVTQSSLVAVTNEEGTLVKVAEVAILQWAWLMQAQQYVVVLMLSPHQMSLQNQAEDKSELTQGSLWQNA